jgi:hypothetical protein
MKTNIFVIASVVALFTARLALAQGTLYVSGIGQSATGSAGVGSDAWFSESFLTGPNPGGYLLNSIQVAVGQSPGSPAGLNVSIYNNSYPNYGINIGSLNGSDPNSNGIFSYTASGIVLSPSRYYCLIFTALTPVAQGLYSLPIIAGNAYATSDSWSMGGGSFLYSSVDGLDWRRSQTLNYFAVAINATAVPEPSSLCLLGMGGAAGLFFMRRKVSMIRS